MQATISAARMGYLNSLEQGIKAFLAEVIIARVDDCPPMVRVSSKIIDRLRIKNSYSASLSIPCDRRKADRG